MAHQRSEKQFFQAQHDDRARMLRDELKANNWINPPLPRSQYIRLKSTGEVMLWNQAFANRSDLCENCDRDGNTDPSKWSVLDDAPAQTDPQIVMNTQLLKRAAGDVHAPATGTAAEVLGVDKQFAKDYTNPDTVNEALPLPEQVTGTDVNALVKAVFKDNKW